MKLSYATLKELKRLEVLTSNQKLKFYQKELAKERIEVAVLKNHLYGSKINSKSGLRVVFKKQLYGV